METSNEYARMTNRSTNRSFDNRARENYRRRKRDRGRIMKPKRRPGVAG